MNKLILIRGPPGSGKSTLAKELAKCDNCIHIEADMYFMVNGEYKFDPTLLKHAHEWCMKQTKSYLDKGYTVIVSNTFVKRWEMKYYFGLSNNPTVLTCKGEYKSIHNVPEEVISRMKANWEEM